MIAHNSNEGSRHIGVVWYLWHAADSAHALGQLVAIDYSDSTPDVAFTYDRLGRQLTVTDVLGTRTNVYDALNLLEERHPSDAARYHYDAAENPVDRAELGLDVTTSFNNLNQIVTGSWTGSTLTMSGTVNHRMHICRAWFILSAPGSGGLGDIWAIRDSTLDISICMSAK